jgi:1-acyl-sn-glycerol-3-phosphate acyltransferase
VLKAGQALLMAPEGTRSEDGSLQRAKDGPALLAMWTGAPILPVAISGPREFWRNLTRLRRTPVRIRVAPLLTLEGRGRRPSREAAREGTREIMWRLAAMLPREARGAYSDLPQAYRAREM